VSVDPSLGVRLDPTDEPTRLPTGNWLQDEVSVFPQPLWVERASEVPARLCPEVTGGLFALVAGFPGPHRAGPQLMELTGWAAETTFHVSMVESNQPIAEGFLRRLRFWRSKSTPTHGSTVNEVLRRFVRSEEVRVGDAEKWLRAKLGPKRPPGALYNWIDYPGFDSGSGDLGFATLFHGPELHVWSRFIHHHK
jgi:hypothetical protein